MNSNSSSDNLRYSPAKARDQGIFLIALHSAEIAADIGIKTDVSASLTYFSIARNAVLREGSALSAMEQSGAIHPAQM